MFLSKVFGLRKCASRHSHSARPRRPRVGFRPLLEMLENRLAPATFTVTSLEDDGTSGTFRSAWDAAAANSDPDNTITFADNLAGGTIHVEPSRGNFAWVGQNLTVQGNGVTYDGDKGDNQLPGFVGGESWFTFWDSPYGGNNDFSTASLSNLNFQDLSGGPVYGGAIGLGGGSGPYNKTLSLDHCTLSGNKGLLPGFPAYGGYGAVVTWGGTLKVTSCNFLNNISADLGGAIASYFGKVSISGSTFTNNSAATYGGAIYSNPSTLTIDSSTITGNSALLGADIYNLDSSTTTINSTIGAIYNDTGTVTLVNSTVTSISNNGGTVTTPDSTATDRTVQSAALKQAGTLTADQATGLTSKLQAATQSLDAGKITPGANQLNAFINQVNAFVKSHKLTTAQGQSLTGPVNQLIIALKAAGARLLNDTGTDDSATTDTQPVSDAGQLVTGPVGVYPDNADGTPVSADEQARFDDAIAAMDATFGPYGVDVVDVGAGDAADAVVQVEIADSSAAGSAADGVRGCTVAGQVTLLTGWNWYTSSDPNAIGSNQYDFETIVMHELGHALGLGHSGDGGSVMYPYLAAGQARRVETTQDLVLLDGANNSPEPLLAAPPSAVAAFRPSSRNTTGATVLATMIASAIPLRRSDPGLNLLLTSWGVEQRRGNGLGPANSTLAILAAGDAGFASMVADGPGNPDAALPVIKRSLI